ncbi:hypothetical protein SAMN05216326_13414 [Nitrosomonas marina]|uniref:Uncharacterized protein n=1 Tax=Nitrosomonas marina TaxID=917 RepID=A0A1I0F665_9PROT|nr:hypothetical protein [Nitrosomonas marina]SET53358.1 hypothetical protein SAMN05216326_13414 [Nitrosomonas marina]
MKKLIFFLFFFTVLSLAFNNSLWARGSGGQGTSFGSGGGGGGGHFRGSSGPSHFGGGRGHFSGGHRHFGHHHSRINFGLNFGGFYGPGFYGYPYWSRYRSPYYYSRAYVYPSPLIAPATPPVYIERKVTVVDSTQSQSSYWYYCRNPEGYYPYVKQCPEGWLQVAPQPAPQSP